MAAEVLDEQAAQPRVVLHHQDARGALPVEVPQGGVQAAGDRRPARARPLAVEQLVDGIEMLSFSYGLDSDGDGLVDGYRKAAEVGNWQQVLSVRLALIARGDEMRGAVVVLIFSARPFMSLATKGGASMVSSYSRQPSAHMSDLWS